MELKQRNIHHLLSLWWQCPTSDQPERHKTFSKTILSKTGNRPLIPSRLYWSETLGLMWWNSLTPFLLLQILVLVVATRLHIQTNPNTLKASTIYILQTTWIHLISFISLLSCQILCWSTGEVEPWYYLLSFFYLKVWLLKTASIYNIYQYKKIDRTLPEFNYCKMFFACFYISLDFIRWKALNFMDCPLSLFL